VKDKRKRPLGRPRRGRECNTRIYNKFWEEREVESIKK
jgi:hypothetical protein